MVMDENGAVTISGVQGTLPVQVVKLVETASTNDFLKRCPMPDGVDMFVATAQYQTAGRGLGTNRWESERDKNLLFSLLVQPVTVPVARQFVLSMAAALALKEALCRYAEGFTLKWPNDIYWQDSKISGTLIETSVSGHTLGRCIFGSGININQQEFHSDAPNPVSLCHIIGRETPTEDVLEAVLHAFGKYYIMVAEGRYAEVERLYNASLYRRVGLHGYRDFNGNFMARIDGVGLDGRLRLSLADGSLRSYAFKEVAFVVPKNNETTITI